MRAIRRMTRVLCGSDARGRETSLPSSNGREISSHDLPRGHATCSHPLSSYFSSLPRRPSRPPESRALSPRVTRSCLPLPLRPRLIQMLYFLLALGVPDLQRRADLLPFSAEGKLLPWIEFLKSLGLPTRPSPPSRRALLIFPGSGDLQLQWWRWGEEALGCHRLLQEEPLTPTPSVSRSTVCSHCTRIPFINPKL